MELEDEIKRFIKVWITVFASLVYCYYISKKIPKGKIRLICFLPIISIFTTLPLYLSLSYLIGPTGFFIGWLANFKLLLFAFDKGPLSTTYSSTTSLPHFISIACLPIKIKQNPSSEINIKQKPCPQISGRELESPLNYATKALALVMLTCFHDYYSHRLNKYVLLSLYCFHVYFGLELLLTMFAVMSLYLFKLDIEPHFNHPILSTSLQNFWGRRWNLVVSSILRETIYQPVRSIYEAKFGRRSWAVSFAVVTTFAVSGLMHELIFYYLDRLWPKWDVLGSFVFHGICVAMEIEVKKKVNGKWQLHRLVSGMLTIGYVMFAGIWMVNQLLRCGVMKMKLNLFFVKGYVGVPYQDWGHHTCAYNT